jgi:hypothetical protein
MAGTPGRRFTADDWGTRIVPVLERDLGPRAAAVVTKAHAQAGKDATTGQLVKAVIKGKDYLALRALDKALAEL